MSVADSTNLFLVGTRGDLIVVGLPVHGPMSKDQAVNLAAWLLVLADPDLERVRPLVQEITEA